MKMKNILTMVMFVMVGQSLMSTEIIILNGTDRDLKVKPILYFGGKQSFGKVIENIPPGKSMPYNSGIYTIVGFNVQLKKDLPGKMRQFEDGIIDQFPIAVTNRMAAMRIVKISGNSYLATFYPNKNDRETYQNKSFEVNIYSNPTEEDGFTIID